MAKVLNRIRSAVQWARKPGSKRKLWVQGGLGLVVALLFVGLSAEYTSRPTFCPTCHYMEPYYESWIAAPAHSDISCVKCHFPPGLAGTVRGKVEGLVQVVNYLSASYSRRKPWAEIDDSSCLQSGCHETRKLTGTVAFQGVAFDHKVHLEDMRRGKELRCTSCHSQIVQGDHITVTETSCFLCHMKKPESGLDLVDFERASECTTCHRWDSLTVPVPTEISTFHEDVIDRGLECDQCHAKTVVGDGFVPPENCFSCHSDQERLGKYDEIELLHKAHISDNKIECIQCHLQIQHKIQRVSAGSDLDCSSCHRRTHREQVMLFTGDVGSGESQPSAMFEAGLDCAGCHVFHEELVEAGTERVAQSQSCENCHGQGYNRLLRLWKTSSERNLAEFGRFIRAVDASVKSRGSQARSEAEPHLEEAKSIQHLVDVGKPVHNVTYYDQLIRSGYDYLRKAAAAANVSVPLPEYRATAVPGQCANCHAGIESAETPFGGKTFSHELHVVEQGVTCKSCHSSAVKHGQTILTPETCNSCHHQATPAEVSCESCHEDAAAIYSGEFMGEDLPDYMFEEEVECVDCHIPDDHVVRPTSAVCLDCHDEGYDEDAEEWKTEVNELMTEVRQLLAQSREAEGDAAGYDDVENMLRRIESGSAGGIHNYELTSEMLLDARKQLTREDGATLAADPPQPAPTIALPPPQPDPRAPESAEEDAPEVFVVAEKMPELVGGLAALQSKIQYPNRARRAGVEGRVIVQFIVDEEGNPTKPKVIRGIGAGCDEEAVRALMESRFTPGLQRGVPVKVQMSLPVVFQLED
ncbi:MAG: TonB family protein [Rhodothermia bacterium]|nr:TonB family protein [Rhodothermia bacterium]